MSEETGAAVEAAAPPYSWIKAGESITVTDGNKRVPYMARTKSDPFLVDTEWFVTVKWDLSGKQEDVQCSRCSSTDLEETGLARLRRLKQRTKPPVKVEKKTKLSREKKLKPKKNRRGSRVSEVDVTTGGLKLFASVVDDPLCKFPSSDSSSSTDYSKCSDGTPASSVARLPSMAKVSPSPSRKKQSLTTDESDEEDDLDRKPAARSLPSDTETMNEGTFEVEMGMQVRKAFDGIDYKGEVLEEVQEPTFKNGKRVRVWKVQYEDGDEEDLDYNELLRFRYPPPASDTESRKEERRKRQFEVARKALSELSYTPQEVNIALHKIGPPYTKLQEAALEIDKRRERKAAAQSVGVQEPFEVEIGMEVRKAFDGTLYRGEVLEEVEEPTFKNGKRVIVWKVRYDDGDEEDLDYDELLRFRYPPPVLAPCRGRAMQCLELFCGRGVVSQEFRQRLWKVISVDNVKESNATMVQDVLKLEPWDLAFVPDFIWASLPCHTYSNAAGGLHRSARNREYEKSKEARDNNLLFMRMVKFMKHAKSKHPHLIVCIENPVGSLQSMPLMKKFEDEFGLEKVVVHYCAFGRSEKKPTTIWTNDYGLRDTLSYFKCETRCCMGGNNMHESVQANGWAIDYAVIPQPLAEEVASYVDAKFILNRIRRTKAASPKQEVIESIFYD